VPTTLRPKAKSAERTYQVAMDWTIRILQLSVLAVVLLYGYLLYGLFFGSIGDWGTLGKPQQARIAGNIESAVLYLNIALGLLLLTACLLYYDEESLGYTFVTLAIALYYGLPFLIEQLLSEQLAKWSQSNNTAAMMILRQFRTAALMMAIPGVILVVRDLILRMIDSSRRNREEFRAMQFGGDVKEEAPVGTVLIGMFAKCWQLPFCREAIRKRCPIYHARTRCWRERVGCMCEENVIRHAMDAIIHKEVINKEDPLRAMEGTPAAQEDSFLTEETDAKKADAPDPHKTTQVSRPEFTPPKHVRIPHNPNLPMSVKVERCRNCVIYNEHQRLKYQFFAPIFVIGVPALAAWKIDVIAGGLSSLMSKLDQMLTRLSFDPEATNRGIISSITSTSIAAQYIIIGCLIIIATTMALRTLEYLIFKWKI